MSEYFDTHCHLTLGALEECADEAWARARGAGVSQAMVVGICARTSRTVVEWVRERPGLFASVGVHPNEASRARPGDLDELRRLAGEERVVAIGETGIDLYWKEATLEDQQRWLDAQATLARELDLPLVLHLRDGFAEGAEVLEPHFGAGLRALVHCFTGGPDDLEPWVGWGAAISLSGVVTYPKAKALREAAARVPDELLLVETDAPWLAPTPHRGGRNEPAYVVRVAEEIARVRGRSLAEIARLTTENARRILRVPAA